MDVHFSMDIVIKIIFLSICPIGYAILPDYWPKNCTKMEMYKVTQTVQLEYECFVSKNICRGWFFEKYCRNYITIQTCTYSKDIEVVKYRTVFTCCSGYMDTGNVSYCDKGCEIGMWGMSCDQSCGCPANAFTECNMYTGECTCQAGWMGDNCDQHCNAGYFGQGCDMICLCENNSTCESILGTCDCSSSPGWKGVYCNEACESDHYGVNCAEECSCGPNTTCSTVDGTCTCIAGLTGELCDTVCTNFTYGVDCKQQCTCSEAYTESCDPVSGVCTCKSGYYEENCDSVCADGFYGSGCTGICNCSSHEMCNPFTGECISKCLCNKNGTSNCQNDSCPCPENRMEVFMNTNSTEELEAYYAVTECCFPSDLLCTCKEGWQGVFCQSACSSGTYGDQCSSSCNCTDSGSCNHITGECPVTSSPAIANNVQAQRQESSTGEPDVATVVLAVLLTLLLIVVIVLLVFCIVTGRMRRFCKKNFRKEIRKLFRETSRKIRSKFGGTYHEATFPTTDSETAPYNVLERDYKKDEVMVGGSLYSHAVDTRGRGQGISTGRSMYDHTADRRMGNKITTGGSSLYSHAVDSGYNTAGTGSDVSQVEDSYGYSRSTAL